jgi:hypothetical protein
MTAAEAALVGKWGVFRTSWGGGLALGQIVKFTAQRVYTARRMNPTPRERSDLLAVFETEADAGRAAQAYDTAYRAGQDDVKRTLTAYSAAKIAQTAGAETAAVVGSLPLPPA